jgi:Domain of unknown function (DUF4145)
MIVSIKCGVCKRFGTFDVKNGSWYAEATWMCVTKCPNPACKAITRFVAFEIVDFDRPSRILVDPSSEIIRTQMKSLDLVPERVRKAYLASLDAFNAGLPDSVATSARKTLEGAIKMTWENPDETQGVQLNQLIKRLPENFDLTKPITDLAHALRNGGNLAAHFDLDRDVTPELAKKMIETIEYVLEYLYVIPQRIEELQREV